MQLLEQLAPSTADKVKTKLENFCPGASEIILGFAFTDVIARQGIDLRTREMLTIAMLSAMGTAPDQLDFHMRAAMSAGVTREEIVEIALQVAVYAGVPACINAINSATKAFDYFENS
ncbi:carboxymuconolactone decarboxylase family protein [Luminiphilus syltensis NOR5-1B]|uniref:Carboxymuconolactone decarboxylase family protein n=2 Tax=Luminiphilus TaxID=1341118 RepID=B8KXR4_9GAMM|nr:carboxymuconolactone decarboxylase family protein [Luminiphilus syltensis NOR5-1B]